VRVALTELAREDWRNIRRYLRRQFGRRIEMAERLDNSQVGPQTVRNLADLIAKATVDRLIVTPKVKLNNTEYHRVTM
jgi:hypothetical protein